MKRYICMIFCAMIFLLSGCGEEEHPIGSACYTLYFVSNDSTKLITKEYWTTTTDEKELFEELRDELSQVPEKLEYMPPFGSNVTLRKWKSHNGRLLLDFEARYAKLSDETEVLTRAAIVKTFTQIKGINYVSFQVDGKDLEDNLGKLVGAMYADSFIYNEGAQINSFEEITLNLFFANEEGDALIKTEKTIMYNTNVAMERVILEQLIAGSKGTKGYATINPDTKVLSVVVKDSVCYVNLNNAFLTPGYSVTPEVVIYSIVNSLCEVSQIQKVQISVDGDTSIIYRDKMQLNATYERNLDLMDKGTKN